MEDKIQLFEQQQVRTAWDEDAQEWYFSIVDVVAVLTESPEPRKYWSVLKTRLKREGSELTTDCSQLKMRSADGKMYLTDVATTEQLLRLIQSIPSKKAEPFKLWLAQVGADRLNEAADPELTIERAMKQYKALGYDDDWINLRLQSIQIRKGLTDEWDKSGVGEGLEYAILTNLMTKEWAGKTVAEYKAHKGLKKESLRDNMTNLELVLNMLAEATTTEYSKAAVPETFGESKGIAVKGAGVAGNARKEIEATTGKPVISSENAETLQHRGLPRNFDDRRRPLPPLSDERIQQL